MPMSPSPDRRSRASATSPWRNRLAGHFRPSRLLIAALAVALAICVIGEARAQGNAFGAPHPTSGLLSQSGPVAWMFAKQAEFYRSLSGFIRASKNDGTAAWALFGISFLYGIFHAIGPGHGKAVISSYVVANEESWRRGVVLSFASAAIQPIVAVIIVAIAAVMLGATAMAIGSTVHLVEIVSYALVILIGVRLLFVKGRGFLIAYRKLYRSQDAVSAAGGPRLTAKAAQRTGMSAANCPHCRGAHTGDFHCHGGDDHDHHASAWSHGHGPEPAELAGAGGWRRGMSAVLAVGLRPCSGAIIVLIFALAQDVFWTGVGATLMMGLGTAITVAAIATVAVGARQLAGRIATARPGLGMLVLRAIEVCASGLIALFGALLLAGYMASERLWMLAS